MKKLSQELWQSNMHPDLSNHLHTDECNALIAAYQQCHVENPYKKFMGQCNTLERAVSKCLAKELEDKRRNNNALAKVRRKKMSEQEL